MADNRPSLDELTQRRRTINGIYANSYWKHRKSGSVYVIRSISLREADYEPIMAYAPVTHPDMEFDRPLAELLEATPDGSRFFRVFPKVTYGT
jgi:hypothetical protein